MTRALTFTLTLALAGCCGSDTFFGEAGTIAFGSATYEFCTWAPPVPVALGSSLYLGPVAAEGTPAEVFTITSDDSSIVDPHTLSSVAFTLDALAVGTTTVRADSSTGRTDHFELEVAEPVTVELLDPASVFVLPGETAVGMGSEWDAHGAQVWEHPQPPLVIAAGGPLVDFWVGLLDASGRDLMWTASALDIEAAGIEPVLGEGWWDIRIPTTEATGSLTMTTSAGVTLWSGDVRVEREPGYQTIELGALVEPREELPSTTDEGGFSVATLRALVRDAEGNIVWQPPVEWAVVGDGDGGIIEQEGESRVDGYARTDLFGLSVNVAEVTSLAEYRSCVTASVARADGSEIAASIRLDPKRTTVAEGDICRGGCDCRGTGETPLVGLSLLIGLVLLRRRGGRPPV